MQLIVIMAFFWFGLALPVQAGEVSRGAVQQGENGRYTLSVSVRINAPLQRVRAMLIDFEHLNRLDSSIQSSRVLRTEADGAVVVEVVSEDCVLLYCQRVTNTQRVVILAEGRHIHGETLPSESNLRYGQTDWRLTALSERETAVDFQAVIEPDFWMPPMVDTWVMERTLRTHWQQSIAAMEGSN